MKKPPENEIAKRINQAQECLEALGSTSQKVCPLGDGFTFYEGSHRVAQVETNASLGTYVYIFPDGGEYGHSEHLVKSVCEAYGVPYFKRFA